MFQALLYRNIVTANYSNMETYITIRKIDSQREFKPGLCNKLEGWNGEGGERDIQVRGDTGKPMADAFDVW